MRRWFLSTVTRRVFSPFHAAFLSLFYLPFLTLLLEPASATDEWAKAPVQTAKPSRQEIPDAHWERIFFEAIDKRTKQLGIYRLRDVTLPADDIEIRIWIGFGLSPLQTILIRRVSGQWSGWQATDDRSGNEMAMQKLGPRSDWATVWNKLYALKITDLPDSSSLPDQQSVFDGVSYVVEINSKASYRTYEYGNPSQQRGSEPKAMLRIMRVLDREFGLQLSDLGEQYLPNWIEDGQVVLVRKGTEVGAFIAKGQTTTPEAGGSFIWRYRTDGNPKLSAAGFIEGPLKSIESISGRGLISQVLRFGAFEIGWSGRSQGEGYLLFPVAKTPDGEAPLEIALTTKKTFDDVDATDPTLEFLLAPSDQSPD